MFVFEPKASYVIASNSGKGFVVDENHLIAQTRNGRKIMNMAEGETASFCRKITGDMIAVVGDNRKMLIFNEADGFTFEKNSCTKTETELLGWLGHRGQVGKLVPFGFLKTNKFFK